MRKMALAVVTALVLTGLSAPAEAAWTFERLSDNSGGLCLSSVAVSGSNVYVVWYDDTFGNLEIFYKRGP